VWKVNFKRLDVSIDGEADGLNSTSYDSFRIADLLLHAFSGLADSSVLVKLLSKQMNSYSALS